MDTRVAHYYTPQFEQETLANKGIDAKNWRRGDLALFVSDGIRLPENIALRVEEDQWHELIVGKIKVKVRVGDENPNKYVSPELLDFADGKVALPTVSRRDPIRSEIDLWTSTQRGFKIKGRKAIWKIVEGIRDNLSLEDILENIRQAYLVAAISDLEKPAIEKVWRELRNHLRG